MLIAHHLVSDKIAEFMRNIRGTMQKELKNFLRQSALARQSFRERKFRRVNSALFGVLAGGEKVVHIRPEAG